MRGALQDVEAAELTLERHDDRAIEERAVRRLGTTLKGKWRLESILGIGGTAAVYSATHRSGKRVAVKMLHSKFSAEASVQECFGREGYISNRVDHPDVVSVFDDDVDEEGCMFLVMEMFEGEPVSARWEVTGWPLPLADTLWLADRLLSILQAVHAKGIVHCDVKPENLFFTSTGCLKLLDFGMARLAGDSTTLETSSGIVMGTPGFAAPEQARGKPQDIDFRSDLWAVGATVLSLLTGRSVHDGGSALSQLVRTALDPAQPAHRVDRSMPKPLARLIDRALSFRPQDRFQTAADMRAAVRATFMSTLHYPMPVRPPSGTLPLWSIAAPVTPAGVDRRGSHWRFSHSRTRAVLRRAVITGMVSCGFALGYSTSEGQPEASPTQAPSMTMIQSSAPAPAAPALAVRVVKFDSERRRLIDLCSLPILSLPPQSASSGFPPAPKCEQERTPAAIYSSLSPE